MTLHRGKLATTPIVKSVRPLTREDLGLLREPRVKGAIAKIRDPHHRLARLIAAGIRNSELPMRSGYSAQSIARFRGDPAFQELVSSYREKVLEAYVNGVEDYAEMVVGNAMKAERMLAEKLESADEDEVSLPVRDLIAISRDAADRFGYGKRNTTVNVNVDFAANLERARRAQARVVEARPNVMTVGPSEPQVPVTPSPRLSESSGTFRREFAVPALRRA